MEAAGEISDENNDRLAGTEHFLTGAITALLTSQRDSAQLFAKNKKTQNALKDRPKHIHVHVARVSSRASMHSDYGGALPTCALALIRAFKVPSVSRLLLGRQQGA